MLITDRIPPKLKTLLQPDPTEANKLVKQFSEQDVSNDQADERFDVIFPVLHGTYGEDGAIQGLFELMDVPYVGAGVLGSSVAMDKVVQKHLFRSVGLPVVNFLSYNFSVDLLNDDQEIGKIETELAYPIFVKPTNMGSSVGINKAHNRQELKEWIKVAFEYDRKIILEESVENAREIEVSVLGNENPRTSVPGEVIPSGEFYDYDSKYVDDASKLEIPAKLPADIILKIQKIAVEGYLLIGCEGMARVDFLLGKDKIYINEINSIPGFTAISMFPKLWASSGLSYSRLLDELIRLAIERQQQKLKLKRVFDQASDWYKK